MTRQIGHNAFSTPSSVAVAIFPAGNFQQNMDNSAVRIHARKQALCPGIFKTLSAITSQRIGIIASRNRKTSKIR